ncbi:hypothetical protein F2Q69_00011916 [Brassica cretica]|uniref:Uncharacterized protein n=1 Tax=Brassica cretica TaxID=69181 RepID=A0A8S9R181_BRACR|nr:hypothetical protein F2Q69_00011916 [Brassica cretica]
MGVEKYLGLIAGQKFTGRTEIRPMDREARGGSLHGFRSLTSGRSGGVLHVSWTCSQPCGARGAAVHASGAMRSDTRATTNLMLIERLRGQFSTDFESVPRDGSVQLNSSRSLSSFDDRGPQYGRVTTRQPQYSRVTAGHYPVRVTTQPWAMTMSLLVLSIQRIRGFLKPAGYEVEETLINLKHT